jgi:hypothetical protein
MAALYDSPHPGKFACGLVFPALQKPKELGYLNELWTTRLLAQHTLRARTEDGGYVLVVDSVGHSLQDPGA